MALREAIMFGDGRQSVVRGPMPGDCSEVSLRRDGKEFHPGLK